MAFEYFLYRTDYNNTLVDRGATSFAPLPPNTGEINTPFTIPQNQPLYFYKELSGSIVLNDDSTIESYLNSSQIITSDSSVTFGQLTGYTATTSGAGISESLFTGYTATTETRLNGIDDDVNYLSGQTANKLNVSSFNSYSATTQSTINGKLNSSLFNTYTGTTAPATYQSRSSVNTLTGTTLPNTYQSRTSIDIYTGTTAPNQFADKTIFNQFTGSTESQFDGIINILTGDTVGETITHIPFHSNATGALTLTNQAVAAQFLANSNRNITKLDLTNAIEIKLITRVVTASASINTPILRVRYKTDAFSTVVTDYIDIGTSPVETSLLATGIIDTGWITITPLAKTNINLIVDQIGGNGAADPSLGMVIVSIKYLVKGAGLSEAIFNTYTGTTAPATYQSRSSINTLTGTTLPNTYVAKTVFSTFTGTTALQSANNGLNKIGTNVRLGGALTGNTTITTATGSRLNIAGWPMQYATDLSANYNIRSLVDRGYVTGITNTKIDKVTGATNNLAVFDVNGNVINSNVTIQSLTGGTGFYFYTEKTVTQNNTTNTNVVYITGVSPTLTAGTWSVDFNAAAGNTSSNRSVVVGFYIDNILQGVEFVLQANSGSNVVPFTLSRDLILTNATHTFQIRFRQSGGGTAFISYGSIRARIVK